MPPQRDNKMEARSRKTKATTLNDSCNEDHNVVDGVRERNTSAVDKGRGVGSSHHIISDQPEEPEGKRVQSAGRNKVATRAAGKHTLCRGDTSRAAKAFIKDARGHTSREIGFPNRASRQHTTLVLTRRRVGGQIGTIGKHSGKDEGLLICAHCDTFSGVLRNRGHLAM